ncbi:hypothetical protein BDV25DRAFT_166269 [Aspergillus avenaceus]|uniref:Uncharacterized protein n=1 Tax=Aspergillus avenaceus TaxID=36643 RepID=A0A5N6TEZ1_ASPAV|nr:hypothetical protein BDV25DRAFT_166269 [Aspergillus avenaceus]
MGKDRRTSWIPRRSETQAMGTHRSQILYIFFIARCVDCQKFVWRNTTSGDRFVKPRVQCMEC